MTDAIIDRISPSDLDTIVHIYNSVFRPQQDVEWFARRFDGRRNTLIQVARIGNDAVGFYAGLELKPDTHCPWLVGVVPEVRRSGVATQLMHAAQDWARTEGYAYVRFEVPNHIRTFLQFGIANDYDIVGTRLDGERINTLVVFEKHILPHGGDEPGLA